LVLYRMTRMRGKFRIIWRLPIKSQKTSLTFVSSYFLSFVGRYEISSGLGW
jgi:hypothetical protein